MSEHELGKYYEALDSPNPTLQYEGLQKIRSVIVSADEDSVKIAETFINYGIINKLLEFLSLSQDLKFQLESCWIITALLAKGIQCEHTIAENGGIELLEALLHSKEEEIVEQVLWEFVNLTEESFTIRDLCVEKGCLFSILELLQHKKTSHKIQEIAVWVLSNFSNGPPYLPIDQVFPTMKVLKQVLEQTEDFDTITNALWCLANFSAMNIEEVADFFPFIEQYLYLPGNLSKMWRPILKILKHAVHWEKKPLKESPYLEEFVPHLFKLTTHTRREIRKDTCWVLCRLVEEFEGVKMLLKTPLYFKQLLRAIQQEKSDARKELLIVFNEILISNNEILTMIREIGGEASGKIIRDILEMEVSTPLKLKGVSDTIWKKMSKDLERDVCSKEEQKEWEEMSRCLSLIRESFESFEKKKS